MSAPIYASVSVTVLSTCPQGGMASGSSEPQTPGSGGWPCLQSEGKFSDLGIPLAFLISLERLWHLREPLKGKGHCRVRQTSL